MNTKPGRVNARPKNFGRGYGERWTEFFTRPRCETEHTHPPDLEKQDSSTLLANFRYSTSSLQSDSNGRPTSWQGDRGNDMQQHLFVLGSSERRASASHCYSEKSDTPFETVSVEAVCSNPLLDVRALQTQLSCACAALCQTTPLLRHDSTRRSS